MKPVGKVILDNECKEYREGWMACNAGNHYLSNPYSALAYDGELYRLWQKGFYNCQEVWESGYATPRHYFDYEITNSFSITNQ